MLSPEMVKNNGFTQSWLLTVLSVVDSFLLVPPIRFGVFMLDPCFVI